MYVPEATLRKGMDAAKQDGEGTTTVLLYNKEIQNETTVGS